MELAGRIASCLALALIRCYQRFISPYLGANCRFCPSCSQYAAEAIERHGFLLGVALAAARLLRCGPWHPGGYDPVPEKMDFRKLFLGR